MENIWHIVTIDTADDGVELAVYLMHSLRCSGCLEEKSDKEGCTRLTAYFQARKVGNTRLLDDISSAIANFPVLRGAEIEVSTKAVEDWTTKWRQEFHPFEIAPSIIVTPSWENYRGNEGETVITLDPGMAFGTGIHPTTRLSAQAIWKTARARKSRTSLMDVGTGSGLLAIIGSKLGFAKIVAVENDPEAARAARENFAKNDVADIEILGDIADVDRRFEIIAANILLSTLVQLRDDFHRCLEQTGLLILSGITHDQEDELNRAYGEKFNLVGTDRMDEWSSMSFEHGGDR